MADDNDQISRDVDSTDTGNSSPAANPSGANILAILTGLAGLAGNAAGMFTPQKGALGEGALAASAKYSKQAQDEQDASDQAAGDKKVINTYLQRLGELPETYRPVAQAYASNGDLKSVQHIFEHAENLDAGDKRAANQAKLLALAVGRDARAQNKSDAVDASESLKAHIKDLDSSIPPSAQEGLAIQKLLTTTDPNSPVFSNPGNFSVALSKTGIKANKDQARALFDVVNEYRRSKMQTVNDPVTGVIPIGKQFPQGASPDQLFSDFASKHASPQAVQQAQLSTAQKDVANKLLQNARINPQAAKDATSFSAMRQLLQAEDPAQRDLGIKMLRKFQSKKY